jgi:ribose 5-phosphate isomerase B
MHLGIATDHGGFGLKEDLLIDEHFSARQGVEDDHMNIICIGGRTVGPGVAWDLVQVFLAAEFSRAPRHLRRLGKVALLERHPTRTDR